MASPSPSIGSTFETDERDFLTLLPPEIILKIVALQPLKFYLTLVHISKHLRNFMKLNANRICNEAIRARFPLQVALLHSELKSGWLVPTHQKLVQDEKRYQTSRGVVSQRCTVKYYDLLGEIPEDNTLSIKVTTPGPQYLYFLEQGILQVADESAMRAYLYLQEKGTARAPPGTRPDDQFIEEKVDGKKYFWKLRVSRVSFGGPLIEEKFFSFLQVFNCTEVDIKKGVVVPRKATLTRFQKEMRFPRELIWFYGVERLEIKRGKDVMDDMNKIPVLVWE